jgi:ribosome maturation factor RimP
VTAEKGRRQPPFFVEAGISCGARPSFGPGVFYTGPFCQKKGWAGNHAAMPTVVDRIITESPSSWGSMTTQTGSMETQAGHTTSRHSPAKSLEDRIRQFAEEVIQRDDWFVVGIQVRGQKGSRVVEVYVDGDEGISVEDMATLSREIAFLLDTEDIIKGKYNLNVSSPGDDRALLFERQYRRHVGKPLQVLVNREDDGIWVEGENLGVKDGVLTLQTKSGVEELPLEGISKARIKLPW